MNKLTKIALEVEKDAALQSEMEEWVITLLDGLDQSISDDKA